MRRPAASAGFTLIELMVTLAVLGVVIMIGLPSMSTWLQNTQLKSSAEAMVSGLQLARAEALRRNANVRFQLVDVLNAGCAVSPAGASWVVSLADVNGLCHATPIDPADPNPPLPQIVQKKSNLEGSPNAVVAALDAAAAPASVAVFNGLGRLVGGAGTIAQISITNTEGGACQPGGPMRCLSVRISTGGQVRMCDPIVTNAADPRFC